MLQEQPVSVIIPSYRNEELLVRSLTHNLPHLHGCEIILINDYPATPLKPYLDQLGSVAQNITLVENERNLGFAGAVNRGVTRAGRTYCLLLNTDVFLNDNHFLQLLDKFQDKKLFGITLAQQERDGHIVGKNTWRIHQGLLHHNAAPDTNSGPSAWAECGSALIDRDKFLKLHGLDEIYSPFYWEDIDLSYRAKLQGWYVWFAAEVIVEHHHEGTTAKYFDSTKQEIALRNQFLFCWRNFRGHELLTHLLWLPMQLARLTRDTGLMGWRALGTALARLISK